MSHFAWVQSVVARGVFVGRQGLQSEEGAKRRQQRLLANVPFFPEARHDAASVGVGWGDGFRFRL